MPNAPLNTPHGSISLTYQSSSPVKRNKEFALTWLLDLSSATPANNGVHPCPDGQFHHIKVWRALERRGLTVKVLGTAEVSAFCLPRSPAGCVSSDLACCFLCEVTRRVGNASMLLCIQGLKEGRRCHSSRERSSDLPPPQNSLAAPLKQAWATTCLQLGSWLPAGLCLPLTQISTEAFALRLSG